MIVVRVLKIKVGYPEQSRPNLLLSNDLSPMKSFIQYYIKLRPWEALANTLSVIIAV